MKKLILMIALTSATYSNAALYSMSCEFVSSSSYQDIETTVTLNCDNGFGQTRLFGANNSPCLASDNLKQFFAGSTVGEKVQIIGETGIYSFYSGLVESFDVSTATRANSDQILKAPTIIHHGKPKACNNTQIAIRK